MASLSHGYDYDVFISYRHKDDKYDHWVTDFVSNLKRELEATFRDEISVYFDNNPSDGLLPSHDVDESVKARLRCLVFIPVISHTYCDPVSYAWANEFKVFVEQASSDKYGLKIRLPNGNYASRVLPVIIHDLPDEEKTLCERILGSQLRGIEFVYREAGVNRPLRPDEDNPHDNLNHTTYRNQINKTANAIKEIITSLINSDKPIPENQISRENATLISGKTALRKYRMLAGVAIGMILIMFGFIYIPRVTKSEKINIAVLPFNDLSVGEDQRKFTDGVNREIMSSLFQINGFSIPGSTATEKYAGSNASAKDIASELGVSYLLEGDVIKEADRVQIRVRLQNGRTGQIQWSHDYDTVYIANNMVGIIKNIAQQIAATLDIAIGASIKNHLSFQVKNNEAYDLYLKTKTVSTSLSPVEEQESMNMFEKITRMEPDFAPAYVELAFFYIYGGGHNGHLTRDDVLSRAEPLISKALRLDKNSAPAHLANALIRLFYYQDLRAVKREFKKVKRLNPANTEVIAWFSDYLHATGEHKKAFGYEAIAFANNKNTAGRWVGMSLAFFYDDQKEMVLKTLEDAWKQFPEDGFLLYNSIRLMDYLGEYQKAIDLFKEKSVFIDMRDSLPITAGYLGVASYKTGDTLTAEKYLDYLIRKSERSSIGSPAFYTAGLYTAMNEKEKALEMLERSRVSREVEFYWLKADPLFQSLHDDPAFKKILKKTGF